MVVGKFESEGRKRQNYDALRSQSAQYGVRRRYFRYHRLRCADFAILSRYRLAVAHRRSRPRYVGQDTLWHGDNLDVLRAIAPESVDLVYLDPPFKSDQNYNMLYKERDGSRSAAQLKAFTDTWTWDAKAAKAYRQILECGGAVADVMDSLRRILVSGSQGKPQRGSEMLAYLSMMAPRLQELRRVLKPTGSLYLHCDPAASHYLKMVLDAVFGPSMFRNEIVWQRTGAHGSSKRFAPIHDIIFFYTKSDEYTWNPAYMPLPQETADAWFNNVEPGTGRRFNRNTLTAPGVRSGSSGKPWRGIDPTAKGRHWAVPGFARAVIGDLDTNEALDALDKMGRVFWPKKVGGTPMLKLYLDESKGIPALDVWTDIKLQTSSNERIGYPTQKPEDLLDRIIAASSNQGDVVMDPFCGCGTAIDVAQRLKRRWIGIDITHLAIDVIVERLAKSGLREDHDYKVDRRFTPPTMPDIETMARKNKHTFQGWALQQAGIESFQLKPGPDRGIDARKAFFDPPGSNERREIIVSVKGGSLPASCVRDLIGTVQRERAQIGVLLALKKPTKNMIRDAAEAPPYRGTDGRIYPGIQILTVQDLLDGHSLEYPLQLVASTAPASIPKPAARPFQLEAQNLPRRMVKAALPLGFNQQKRGRR